MALQGKYIDNFGVVHEKAYAKVVNANGNWLQDKMFVTVCIFADKESRDAGYAPLAQVNYEIQDSGDTKIFDTYFGIEVLSKLNSNPVEESYMYAKGETEDWKDWTDV